MKNLFKKISSWCSKHIPLTIVICVASVLVIASAITLPIVLTGKDKSSSFTVSFNMMNHGEQMESLTVDAKSKMQKPKDPFAIGYKLEDWYTDENLTSKWNFDDTVKSNMTLYAKWTFQKGVYYTTSSESGYIPANEDNEYIKNFTFSENDFIQLTYSDSVDNDNIPLAVNEVNMRGAYTETLDKKSGVNLYSKETDPLKLFAPIDYSYQFRLSGDASNLCLYVLTPNMLVWTISKNNVETTSYWSPDESIDKANYSSQISAQFSEGNWIKLGAVQRDLTIKYLNNENANFSGDIVNATTPESGKFYWDATDPYKCISSGSGSYWINSIIGSDSYSFNFFKFM